MSDSMRRRDFLAASLAAAAPAVAGEDAQPRGGRREFYELRLYHLCRGPMVKRADDYFREALVPALRRHGVGPVGVFNVSVGPDNPTTYVLVPHPSLESFATSQDRLAADAEYQKAGEAFRSAPATDPAYVGRETLLLAAFEQMPQVQVPAAAARQQPRLFELRMYRSHSQRVHQKKIEMFTTGGEIAIFKRVGLQPVFFARTVASSVEPSIYYMLVFPDLATRERNWKAFGADPEWKKLSTTPGYTDGEIVATISNVLLTPAPYSEI